MNSEPPLNVLGIGIDLVEVPRVREMLARHGDRFKERTFTAAERAYCENCADPAMHFAARFAAKEAAAKALGTGLWVEGVIWTDIEVTRAASGCPGLVFTGGAAEQAASLGVKRVLISLSHTRELAIAQVILCQQAVC